jgi:hypothetical protein
MATSATLTAFEESIANIKQRRGVVVFANASDYRDYDSGTTTSLALNTAGIIKDTNVDGEPNEFGPDNQGRTFTKGFDVTANFVAMQTGPNELQNLPALAEPAGNGLYVAFVDNPFPIADQTAGIMMSDITALDKVELLDASVNPSFSLNFSRDESEIGNELTGYISVAELEKIYTEPILMG